MKLNLNVNVTTTFHGKTNENARFLRMRRNAFAHTKVWGSVDARNAEAVDLD
jgi:hypothetical protein